MTFMLLVNYLFFKRKKISENNNFFFLDIKFLDTEFFFNPSVRPTLQVWGLTPLQILKSLHTKAGTHRLFRFLFEGSRQVWFKSVQ